MRALLLLGLCACNAALGISEPHEGEADLGVFVASSQTYEGGSIAYSVQVANAGPSRALELTVDDALPYGAIFESATGDGWTCWDDAIIKCSLPALDPGPYGSRVTIKATLPVGATLVTNTASLSSATFDVDDSNNTASATNNVGPAADLTLAINGPTDVVRGDLYSYVLDVANLGPSPATNALVIFQEVSATGLQILDASGPGWTCSAPPIQCTATTFYTDRSEITVRVTAPSTPTVVHVHAAITSDVYDPNFMPNLQDAATTVD